MVVDDEKLEREGLADALECIIKKYQLDIAVSACCKNALEALELIQYKHMDVVFTDIKMPVLNGIELIKRGKKTDKNSEYVIVSGYDEFDFAREAMKEGVQHYLLKPYGEEELLEILNKLIRKLQQRDEDIAMREWYKKENLILDAEEENVIGNLLVYLSQNLHEPELSLRWYAQNCVFMNEDYLGKLFKAYTGQNFAEYLRIKRLEKAKYLLASMEEEKMYRVAEQIGFGNNPHYFSRFFKKNTGMTPKEFREKYRKS